MGGGGLNLFIKGLDEKLKKSERCCSCKPRMFLSSLFLIGALLYPCHSFHMRHSVCDLFNPCLDSFCKVINVL